MFVSGEVELVSRDLIQSWKDQMKNVAATLELVGSNGGKSKQDRNRAQNPCSRVVARLQQVGDGELRKLAGPWRNDQDHQQACPASRRLPQRGKAVAEGILSASKQAPRTYPRREQREDQHIPGQRAASHQVVGPGFDFADLADVQA